MNSDEEVIRPPTSRKALEWITVLAAVGLDYRLSREESEWILHVPRSQSDTAAREIRGYEETNAGWPPAADVDLSEPQHDTWAAVWGVLFLAWFYLWLGPYAPANAATAAGAADAGRIASGEWWRVVTALTLHSGIPHLAGNALSILLFAHAICRTIGGGLGWLLILGSGVAGNIATALLRSPFQVSVGASTASFGALGIISAYQSIRFLRRSGQWRSVWSRTWIPICAGLALLGFLGAGEGADLAAHLFGFFFGAAFAVPLAWHGARDLPQWAQRALEIFCITVIMLCWRAAFRSAA